MRAILDYLSSDSIIQNEIGDNIFFVEKPSEAELKIDNYIVYKIKPIDGGYIKQYALEINVIGTNLPKLLKVNKRLIELIDDPRNEKNIKDENITITSSALTSGGGTVKNSETGNFIIITYFKLKIKGVF
jgi:hypothetical protein